jgi:hypothetical protein
MTRETAMPTTKLCKCRLKLNFCFYTITAQLFQIFGKMFQFKREIGKKAPLNFSLLKLVDFVFEWRLLMIHLKRTLFSIHLISLLFFLHKMFKFATNEPRRGKKTFMFKTSFLASPSNRCQC